MICISIISYGKIHFDIRVFWITSTFLEWIMLAIQGSTVFSSYVNTNSTLPKLIMNKQHEKKNHGHEIVGSHPDGTKESSLPVCYVVSPGKQVTDVSKTRSVFILQGHAAPDRGSAGIS
jgi:hypothetical protein